MSAFRAERAIVFVCALAIVFAAGYSLGRARTEDDSAVLVTVQRGGAETAPPGDARLDLNAATAAQLAALPGIGDALAARIVAYREEHGAFASVEELTDVSGIGEGKLETIRTLVRIGE